MNGNGDTVQDQPEQTEWAERDYQPGDVVMDNWGDVYARTQLVARPWVLLAHHHANTEHLVGAQAPDDWLQRPLALLNQAVTEVQA